MSTKPLHQRLGEARFEPLTQEEEAELGRRIKEAKTEKARTKAQDEVIERHLRLIVHIGKNYQHRLPHDEVMAVGSLALTQAIRRWDPDRGSAYRWAHRWITTALTKAVDASRTIRIPEAVANEAALLAARIDEIEQAAGRKLTQAERDAIVKDRPTFATLPTTMRSIDEPAQATPEGDLVAFCDIIEDINTPTPHDVAEANDRDDLVQTALGELDEIEREVIRIRFAFDGETRETLAKLGKKYKVSAEAMRRIEMSALAKLRHPALPINLEDLA